MTGYVLAEDAWGLGYATVALAAMVEVAGRTGVIRLYALCHPEHVASRRISEKNGFLQDDPPTRRAEFPNLAPGVQQDALCYVRLLEPTHGAGNRSHRSHATRANNIRVPRGGFGVVRPLTWLPDDLEEPFQHFGEFLVGDPSQAPADSVGRQRANLTGFHPRAPG